MKGTTSKARARRAAFGFSLAEVLISIAVISIAILGTLASLGFGVKATDMSTHYSEALAIERRIMEVILTGGTRAPATGSTLIDTGAYDGADPDKPWRTLRVFAQTAPMAGSTTLDQLISTNTTVDAADVRRYNDMAERYEVRVSVVNCDGVGPGSTSDPRSFLVNVTGAVRWAEKSGRKQVSATAFFKRS